MKLIVGLGNPGTVYAESRHNAGFLVVKALSRAYKIRVKKEPGIPALAGRGKIGRENLLLAMPLTYMNLSGSAVSALAGKYKIEAKDILVVCDDLDLDFGIVRIRPEGSSGGHRGLRSIIASLGSQQFARLRIGIGRPLRKNEDPADFVLSAFNKKDKTALKEIIETAGECCRIWAQQGIAPSMNIFNRRVKTDKGGFN